MANSLEKKEIKINPYEKYLIARGLSDNTIYLYMSYYKRFELYPFSQEGMNQFFSKRKVNNYISRAFIKSLLEFLEMEDQFKLPPKPTGSKKKKIIRPISSDQITEIRNTCYDKSKMSGFLFDLLYYGALRRSEIGKLKINSFNWEAWFNDPTKQCELTIVMGKGNKDRIVLIPAQVVKELAGFYIERSGLKPTTLKEYAYILNNAKGGIFKQPNGKDLSGKYIWGFIKRISSQAIGIEIRPHELRHARATQLQDLGIGIRDIQHFLGHTNPQITEIYLHSTEKQSLKNIQNILTKDL
jgi:integrase/recombinase XerD